MSEISIRQASDADAEIWDDFVASLGSFYHRWGWKEIIAHTYGHEAVFLLAEQDGEICGVLPLIDRRSALFGRALISVGFTVGGGIIATNESAKDELLKYAVCIGKSRKSEYVELRSTDEIYSDWHSKTGVYDTFSTTLKNDESDRLQWIRRKKRADIRKAINSAEQGALQIRISDNYADFWREYAHAQRNHGTPVFPLKWLEKQKAVFGDDIELVIVQCEGQSLAGVINYYHRDTVHLYSSFISQQARQYHAGDYLYWWMMGHALKRGAKIFDLGRSKRGTGAHAYKTHWGFEPVPLHYQYRLLDTEEIPNINPNNPKFSIMSKLWTKLPLAAANRLGPAIAGHLA